MTTYTCKACGKPVAVINGQIVRQCACDAPVTADIKATARGAGAVR